MISKYILVAISISWHKGGSPLVLRGQLPDLLPEEGSEPA